MIYEEVKTALEKLFPQQVAPAEEKGNGEAEEDAKKEQQRPNGIIDADYAACGYHLDVQLAPEQLCEAVTIVDSHKFFLEAITGVDWVDEGELEVVYDFSRYDFDLCRLVIRTRVDRDNAKVPSITGIYAGANWHERETAEFFGINFTGHPHLVPLLLPEDADFHPLRKDFKA